MTGDRSRRGISLALLDVAQEGCHVGTAQGPGDLLHLVHRPVPPGRSQQGFADVFLEAPAICRAGLPPTMANGGTSRVTTAPAATTAPCPMVTPERISAFVQIQQSLPMTTSPRVVVLSGCRRPHRSSSGRGRW